jgi:hypothetical protein
MFLCMSLFYFLPLTMFGGLKTSCLYFYTLLFISNIFNNDLHNSQWMNMQIFKTTTFFCIDCIGDSQVIYKLQIKALVNEFCI